MMSPEGATDPRFVFYAVSRITHIICRLLRGLWQNRDADPRAYARGYYSAACFAGLLRGATHFYLVVTITVDTLLARYSFCAFAPWPET